MAQAAVESGWGTSRFALEGMRSLVNGPGTSQKVSSHRMHQTQSSCKKI